jgi:hypothetical protein
VDGDFYINTTTNTLFGPKSGGAWPSGVSLVGPAGATGATGAQGSTGATGPAGPAPSGTGIVTVSGGILQNPAGALTGDVTTSGAGLVTSIGAGKVTNEMLAGSIGANKLVGTDITTLGTVTSGTWSGTTIATVRGGTGLTSFTSGGALYATSTSALTTGTLPITAGGTGSTTQNFVDLSTDQSIGGIKQFQKAATNTTAFNAGTSLTIDFGQSNLAYTSAGGTAPSYTLSNLKNGGAYTLVLTSTTNSAVPTFTATGFTFKYMGTTALTTGKAHIYSFIAVGTVVYVSMATEN